MKCILDMVLFPPSVDCLNMAVKIASGMGETMKIILLASCTTSLAIISRKPR